MWTNKSIEKFSKEFEAKRLAKANKKTQEEKERQAIARRRSIQEALGNMSNRQETLDEEIKKMREDVSSLV